MGVCNTPEQGGFVPQTKRKIPKSKLSGVGTTAVNLITTEPGALLSRTRHKPKPHTNGVKPPATGLRCIIASDAPWSTSGYANQVALLAPRLAALGHEVALLATFGLHGGVREWNGLRVYPGGADAFANDVIRSSALDWQADIVITLKDSFVFQPKAFEGLRWVGLVPCDHEPAPPAVCDVVRHMYRPVAYAPNGYRELRAAGFDPLFAPHGYDPKLFNPQPKAEARKFLGIPDDVFLVGTVAVNRGGIPSRKAWPQNLEAFALFAKDKPNVRYFLHTNLCTDGFEGGVNLPVLCGQLGIADKIIFCDQERYKAGFPDVYLHALYCAFDVLNAVSLGEGFGIPALEAQGCGCPVITSDFAAQRDLNFAGWKVERGLKFYDGQGSWTFIPEPAAIAEAMEQAYRELTVYEWPNFREDVQARALAGAADYAIDTVVERYWRPALAEIQAQIANEASRGVLRIIRREEVFL